VRIENTYDVPSNHLLFPDPFVHVDPAKYLLTRLCLRKPGKWHRLSSLRYQHELGDNIMAILEMLCVSSRPNTTEHCEIKQEEQEIIDLTLHEMDLQDAIKPPQAPLLEPKAEAGPSSIKIEDIPEQPCGDLSFLAQDHTYAGLPELLNCLSLEELRQLAKDMKIRKPCVNVSSLPHSGAGICHRKYPYSEQYSRAC
jgi:Fanconi-associated nuclease 1